MSVDDSLSDRDHSFDYFVAAFAKEHPWVWRRVRLHSKWQTIVGRFLPWLCRHNGTTGPAGGDSGTCLWCGAEVAWDPTQNAPEETS